MLFHVGSRERMESSRVHQWRLTRQKVKILFGCISAVLTPILLAVFTIILSLQQDSIAATNREVDLRIAADEHRQNQELASDDHRHARLVSYIQEVSDLLLKANFSFTERIFSLMIRPKTLAILSDLDARRKGHLLRFLHESHLISTVSPPFLNLLDMDFSEIQIGTSSYRIDMRRTSFVGANLQNASLTFVSLSYSDFSSARLCQASFDKVDLSYANFYFVDLQGARFKDSSLSKADLTLAQLIDSQLTKAQMDRVGSLSKALMPDGRAGRNANLFPPDFNETFNHQRIHQQNITLHSHREWVQQIGREIQLRCLLTGWFDRRDELRVIFTEWNRRGERLHRFDIGEKVPPGNNTDHFDVEAWKDHLFNHTVHAWIIFDDRTYSITIDLALEGSTHVITKRTLDADRCVFVAFASV